MKKKNLFLLLGVILFFSSCKVFNPTKMLRTGIDYQYDTLSKIKNEEFYRLDINDVIVFTITTNNGDGLPISISGIGQNMQSIQNTQNSVLGMGYLVEYDGTIKLPTIGRKVVKGLSIRELELFLENEYSAFYNKPFVKVDVVNKRVFVFRGSTASVTNLTFQNTTVFQLLAQLGGVGDSKAHRIKLIRNKPDKTYVYSIDLSKIENINQGNIILQANDIIYITPRDKVASEVITALAPYASIVATLVATYAIFKK